jgi:hypothetical protein
MDLSLNTRARAPRAGAVAAVAAGLLLAACGGSPASGPGAGMVQAGTHQQALAYAKCMRAHGVPHFPDPDSQGDFVIAQIQVLDNTVSDARYANVQCRYLVPGQMTGMSATQLQQLQQQDMHKALDAAICMRQHGVPGFPDPTATTTGSGVNWPALPAGIDPTAPQYQAAAQACGQPGPYGNPAGPGGGPAVPPPSPGSPSGGS